MDRILPTDLKLARAAALAFALVALLAVLVAPSQSFAKGTVKFGAKLGFGVFPEHAQPGIDCRQDLFGACTIVEESAFHRPGGAVAPRTGTIVRLRVEGAGAGSFQPQVVSVHHSKSSRLGATTATATYTGPLLHYKGQGEANFEEEVFNVSSFKVEIPIHKGQQLAALAARSSMLTCVGGNGHHTLVYSPPPFPGSPAVGATDANGCFTLIEAVMR